MNKKNSFHLSYESLHKESNKNSDFQTVNESRKGDDFQMPRKSSINKSNKKPEIYLKISYDNKGNKKREKKFQTSQNNQELNRNRTINIQNLKDDIKVLYESLIEKLNKKQGVKFQTSYKNINLLRNKYRGSNFQVHLISLCRNLDKNQEGNLQTYPNPFIQRIEDSFQIPHKIPRVNLSKIKEGNFQSSYDLLHKELNKNLGKNIQISHKIINERLNKKQEWNLQRQNLINTGNYSKKFNETQEEIFQASYENIKSQKIKQLNIDFRT